MQATLYAAQRSLFATDLSIRNKITGLTLVENQPIVHTDSCETISGSGWPYQCWPPKQLAMHGFYKMPGEKGDPIACFSCGKEWHCRCSTKVITDRELL
jgi:hypothetical protein